MRRTLLTRVLLGASALSIAAALGPACGVSDEPVRSEFDATADGTVLDTGTDSGPIEFPDSGLNDLDTGTRDGGGGGTRDGSVEDLVVSPAIGETTVTITNGAVVSSTPLTFTAVRNGQPVTCTWFLDRGELGAIAANGAFAATGTDIGESKVTATLAGSIGYAKVRVKVVRTQSGRPASEPTTAGQGGYAGVGGEPLGGAVDAVRTTKITTAAPTASATFKWLYPYQDTVFPRGTLAPMVQWSFDKAADAVMIKLSFSGGTFTGVYELDNTTTVAAQRAKIEQDVWRAFTNGNSGADADPILLDVRVLGVDGNVYALPQRTLRVAPGQLKGTVYYSSYNSKFTGGAPGAPYELGGVLAIQPKSANPVLAVQAESGKCFGCHSVSADGSTMYAQYGGTSNTPANRTDPTFSHEKAPLDHEGYPWSASYDLRNGGARTDYATAVNATTTDPAVTDDNANKFLWSGVYPDGSFALTSNGYTRSARTKDKSRLYARGTGTEVAATGLENVTDAVTPSFAPNGRRVAFNFWKGTGGNGVTAGSGHSLAMADFSCGQQPGSVACTTAKSFGNLREIFRGDANTYAAWPSFLPDASGVVFQRTSQTARTPYFCPTPVVPPGAAPIVQNGHTLDHESNCHISTWFFSGSEVWLAKDGGAANKLAALNGYDDAGNCTLPASGAPNTPSGDALTDQGRILPAQCQLNYMPTVNPIASGGYYWVVFTSRRRYGNVLDTHPFDGLLPGSANTTTHGYGSTQKKLWVAAVSFNADGTINKASPAFYLPGQELGSGNARGFWAVDPCKGDGNSCESGDECCGGGCRPNDNGALTCQAIPPGSCSGEFEHCAAEADCCDSAMACIGNICTIDGSGR